ncbi:MAG: hypothetical protein JWQ22_817 [Devosia sp.]|nr:hypothetical protein [Devosia sp.]
MQHPKNYGYEEWSAWYERARVHARLTPNLANDLRTGANTRTLIATASASLAELDDDIVAGEFLAYFMQMSGGSSAVEAIVLELSYIAQDLLQAIVEANQIVDPPSC